MREALAAYRAELAALSYEEIVERYNAEKQREFQQAVAKAEREEQEQFYNKPHATADFGHWSKLAHWTLDEAVALSFGKAPEVVNWPTISKYLQISSFAVQYGRRRDLAMRAAHWKQLFDPVLPGFFLAWAKRTDIAVPPELTELVEKRGVQVADWKSLYDEAVAARKRQGEAHETQIADWMRLNDKLAAQMKQEHSEWLRIADEKKALIAVLQARIAELEQSQSNQLDAEPEIGARSRDSLLKLIIGMAVAAYAYDPKAGRSDRPTEIAGDLERAGVPLDVDTVRKWLREAAELLPPKQNE
jgi:hypothetical protein